MSQILNIAQATFAKVPGAPDGLRNSEALAPSEANGSKKVSVVRDILGQLLSGRVVGDVAVGVQALTSAGKPIDDRDMLMEHLIERLVKMDSDSPIRSGISDAFIQLLWRDLPHPVSSLLSDQYRFRQPDGSYNNLYDPLLGAAGQPYARTVPPMHPLPPNLPDPELIFDALLKRDKFVENPSGISSMMFAFAVIIVHSIFRTRYTDPTINEASSYLDLSPLYGNNLEQQMKIRTGKNGHLHPDVIAEDRLFLMPPQVTALLVLFNRNHNYIAEMIFKINEKGKFRNWDELSDEGKAWQDREIFETARHVNCGHFIGIVLHDYVNSILGINRAETDWFLDPTKDMKNLLAGNGSVERGTGNVASAEFNLLYRWHAVLSKADTKWMEDEMTRRTGMKVEDISTQDFLKVAIHAVRELGDDPCKWNIPGVQRGKDGKFKDDDLARILIKAIEEPAGAFRANGIPTVMRPVDCLGMMAARNSYGLCTLNEFRRYFCLKEYATFLEWNEDPEVAAVAEKIYVHPNNIELYVGLLAEQPKPGAMVGSGLAVNHTISRAILADAVALVRGDRFYTTDYNTSTLTSWGMEYITSSMKDGAKGGLLGKLLLRNLPQHFPFNSSYALFPFQTPRSMKEILEKQGTAHKYDFSPPVKAAPWKPIVSPAGVDRALMDFNSFGVIYTGHIEDLSKDRYGFFLGFDNKKAHDVDRKMMDEVVFFPGYEKEYRTFYEKTIRKLMQDSSWRMPGTLTYTCDWARDVGNMASVYWMATYFGIPLKTKESPLGLFTPHDLYMAIAAMFIYVFKNFDPVESFKLREAALTAAKLVCKVVEARIKEVRAIDGLLGALLPSPTSFGSMGPEAMELYRRILKYDRPMDAMVSSCMGLITSSVVNQGQACAQNLNLYLFPKYAEHKQKMEAMAHVVSAETDRAFLMYHLEAQRLVPQVPGIPRVAKKTFEFQDGDKVVKFNAGDMVFVSVLAGNMNPRQYHDPEKIDINRDENKYRLFGYAMHNCLGSKLVNIAQPVFLREVMKLKNLRRAPGKAGYNLSINHNFVGTDVDVYFAADNTIWAFPTSMSIQYDS